MEDPEQIISLSDPGEIDRETHNKADRHVVAIANVVAWLFPALMVAICAQVVMRQLGHNQAWLDDFQWWLYGFACLVGIGYAVTTNSHVRVDIFFDNYAPEKQNRINIFALGWLFLPFIILCADVSVHYAWSSILANEGSDSPNGLHNLWILKVLMFLTFLFIGYAVIATYLRYLAQIKPLTPWTILVNALPATFFIVNLTVFYVIWWVIRLTNGDELNNRQILRQPIFDEWEVGYYDLEYTVLISVAATAIVLTVARLISNKSEA
jgi:TRAP-type mannitol/chloroaromatic compound transport system permease small subunit